MKLVLQVSVTAIEESRVLLWHRDKLKLSIITDQFLQAVFDHVLGRDVVKKLLQVIAHYISNSLWGCGIIKASEIPQYLIILLEDSLVNTSDVKTAFLTFLCPLSHPMWTSVSSSSRHSLQMCLIVVAKTVIVFCNL